MAPLTFTEAEQALMVGVLKQTEVGSLDYEKLCQHVGVESKNAVQVRWCRLRAKLMKTGDGKTEEASEDKTAPTTPKTPKRKKQSEAAGSGKKRKTKKAGADTDDDMAVQEAETEVVGNEIEERYDEF